MKRGTLFIVKGDGWGVNDCDEVEIPHASLGIIVTVNKDLGREGARTMALINGKLIEMIVYKDEVIG